MRGVEREVTASLADSSVTPLTVVHPLDVLRRKGPALTEAERELSVRGFPPSWMNPSLVSDRTTDSLEAPVMVDSFVMEVWMDVVE